MDTNTTGAGLNSCFDLIDVYCSITHGVSIKKTEEVFNSTLSTDFADDGLTKLQCTNIRDKWSILDVAAATERRNFLINIFQSNYIPFVPSAESIINLGKYYGVTAPDKTVKYNSVKQTNTVKGIALMGADGSAELNIWDKGVNSGIDKHTYSSTALGAKVILMVLIGFMGRF